MKSFVKKLGKPNGEVARGMSRTLVGGQRTMRMMGESVNNAWLGAADAGWREEIERHGAGSMEEFSYEEWKTQGEVHTHETR